MFKTPPRSGVQTRRMLKMDASTKLCEKHGAEMQSEPVVLEKGSSMTSVKLHQRPKTEIETSAKSVSSSVLRTRRLKLELQAAEAKATIEKELIDKRLAAEIAALESDSRKSDKSYCTESSSKKKVENWLESSRREMDEIVIKQELVSRAEPLSHLSDRPQLPHSQPDREPTDIEKLAGALKDAITVSVARVPSSEMFLKCSASKDLPLYFGDPMEWLQFRAAYYESMSLCKFSDNENVYRLRKCLRGEAKEAVVSMLIGNTSPDVIMQSLELRFGRPELIINRIVLQIKKLPPLPHGYHNEIVNFATKIKNFAVAAVAINQSEYLRSPELITSVVSKFPSDLIHRWTDYAYQYCSNDKSKFEVLADFLINEATKAAAAGVSHIHSQTDSYKRRYEERRGPSFPVLVNSEDEKCRFCKLSVHQLPDCPRFKRAMRRDRWRFVRVNRLCFKCLILRHDKDNCSARACDVDKCGQNHHKLLHYKVKRENVNICDNIMSNDNNTIESVKETVDSSELVTNTTTQNPKVLLKVVPLTVHGPNGSVTAHALLDDGATLSLLSADLADQVGLHGHSETLRVRGAWDKTELRCESEIVNFVVTNSNGDSFSLRARKMNELNLPAQKISYVNFDSYEHLQDFKDRVSQEDIKPQLLIGQDHYHLLAPLNTIVGNKNKPYVTRTLLGWCIHGVVGVAPTAAGRQDSELLTTMTTRAAALSAPPALPAPAAPAATLARPATLAQPALHAPFARPVAKTTTLAWPPLHVQLLETLTNYAIPGCTGKNKSIVNSRPLTHVSVEPGSDESVTPNHFLLGTSSALPVTGVFDDTDLHLRKQWRIAERLTDMYWKRWVKEVLPEMLPRAKWHQERTPLKVSDMVLVVDPDGPRNTWPRGIIVETLPGKDGQVRVAMVKTKSGLMKRSAARLALIPIID